MKTVSLAVRLAICAMIAVILLFTSASASAQTGGPVRRLRTLPASGEARVALPNSVTQRPGTSAWLGHLPASTAISGMSLVLTRTPEQEAALNMLLQEQQDPTSPQYHQWLTPQQFGTRFGVADQDLQLVRTWLESRGLSVQEIAPSRNRILFSGSASAVEAALDVTLGRYSRDGQIFYENSDAVHLPASLASVVGGVSGLSSYRLSSSAAMRRPLAQTSVSPQYTTGGGSHYLVPWDFRQIFGMNTLIAAGNDGTGISIGVIGQSAVDMTQLTYFQQKTGQTVKLPNLVLVPGTGVANSVAGDESESELDLEYASGSAPGASVQFVYTGCGTLTSSAVLPATTDCNNDGIFNALAYAVTNDLAPILTVSYSGCEADLASYASSTMEPILKQSNVQGQTILVSSGDTGAATCDQGSKTPTVAQHGLTVSYPASSPYVIAVGGTQLADGGDAAWSSTNNSFGGSALGYIQESAWNDSSTYGQLAASGGGVSKIFLKPDWQVGNGVPQDGHRDVPDVAFPASITHTPYFVCSSDAACQSAGGFGSGSDGGGLVGGTSLSAPNFAAMLAVVEQANGGGALGNINPRLYALAEGVSASTIFHDIANGDNKVTCLAGSSDCLSTFGVQTLGYSTATGYDLVTGLGSLDAVALQASLISKIAAVQLTASSTMPVLLQPVTFTARILGNPSAEPSATVTFSAGGTVLASSVPLVNGVAAYAYSGFDQPSYFAGPTVVKATYSGDANFSSSSSSVTISPIQVMPAVTIAIAPTNPVTNTSITITVRVSGSYGAPKGSVLLLADQSYLANALAPAPLIDGVGTYVYKGFATAGAHSLSAQFYSLRDQQNGSSAITAPYGPYEGGSGKLDLQVSSSTQTLTPVLTVTGVPTAVLAPTDALPLVLSLTTSGPLPTGNYTYSLDGAAPYITTTVPTISPYSLTFLPPSGWQPGPHTVLVRYNGDNNYLPSAPITVTFRVAAPSFTLSSTPSVLTISGGSSGAVTLTVNSGPTYTGLTSFKLQIVQTTGAAFFGCYSLPLTPLLFSSRGVPISTTLTMISGATVCSSPLAVPSSLQAKSIRGFPRIDWVLLSAGLVGGCALRYRRRVPALLLVFLLTVLLTTEGCGGTGSSSSSSSSGAPGTGTGTGGSGTGSSVATGSYVFQVTGVSAVNPAVTAVTNFTLVVH